MLAEVVLVLPCVEEVLRQVRFTRYEAKAFWPRHGGPEASPAADRAVAAIGTLREVKLRLELDRTAVATALIGFQHRLFLENTMII